MMEVDEQHRPRFESNRHDYTWISPGGTANQKTVDGCFWQWRSGIVLDWPLA